MDEKFEIRAEILKYNEDRRLVFGFASVSVLSSGETVVDLHNEIITPEVLEKAAYNYVIQSRVGGEGHTKMGVAVLVESAVITAEKLAAMGISAPEFAGAKWWVGYRVDDPDVWAGVKTGKYPAFSIGGTCTRRQVE